MRCRGQQWQRLKLGANCFVVAEVQNTSDGRQDMQRFLDWFLVLQFIGGVNEDSRLLAADHIRPDDFFEHPRGVMQGLSQVAFALRKWDSLIETLQRAVPVGMAKFKGLGRVRRDGTFDGITGDEMRVLRQIVPL